MVIFNKKTSKSGKALQQALEDYDGLPINWGNSSAWCGRLERDVLNKPVAVARATNKRIALHLLTDANIPTALVDAPVEFPLVGRPDYHSQGRYLRYIENQRQLERDKRINRKHPTTHYQLFIANAREFRVHVVNGYSIKVSEKIGVTPDQKVKNHRFGSKCAYPHDFNHKKTLRKTAKSAVECLGLDFGAVDILWREDIGFKVLEVNSAPCLTDLNSDTLERYVNAFQLL